MFFGKWSKQEKVNKSLQNSISLVDKSLKNSFSNVKTDVEHIQKWIEYLHAHQDKQLVEIRDNSSEIRGLSEKFEEMVTQKELRGMVDDYYTYADQLHKSVLTLRADMDEKLERIYTNQKSVFDHLTNLNEQNRSLISAEVSTKLATFRQEIGEKSQDNENNSLKSEIFSKLDVLNERIDKFYIEKKSEIQKESPKTRLKEKVYQKITRRSKEYVKSMLTSLIKKYGRISGLNLREIVVEEQNIVSKSSFYRLLAEIESEEEISVVHEGKEKHYIWGINSLARSP